ncbi:hypothetical protein SMD44_02887 [Streptomyces alboflavus]|uniref:Uncharacterized protein n=1 Tax=Streptomyces alboflavus TaxID=67267 RepID=A0A1Z1WAM7_9ACTN|nr:hypothetical protein SMD44_02887 [Streptomyces alboflavus]
MQGLHAGVEFLGAAAGLRLAVLAVVPLHPALLGTGLPLVFPAPACVGLQLALLLPLDLGPDTDKTT